MFFNRASVLSKINKSNLQHQQQQQENSNEQVQFEQRLLHTYLIYYTLYRKKKFRTFIFEFMINYRIKFDKIEINQIFYTHIYIFLYCNLILYENST